MKISFKVNGEWFGSRLDAPGKLLFEISVRTENENGIGLISIVGEDNIIIASRDAGARRELTWSFECLPEFDYYYLKITAPKQYTVTAPVWIEYRKAELTSLTVKPSGDDFSAKRFATLKNKGSKNCRDIRVDYHLAPSGSFELDRRVPYRTVAAGRLSAEKTLSVSLNLPNVPGLRRLCVIIRGICGGKRFMTVGSVLLTPVVISRVLPMSDNESGISDAFPYIELKNITARDYPLTAAALRLWIQTGKAPLEERTMKLDEITIPAIERCDLDQTCGSGLTEDDFNAHYGTDLYRRASVCDGKTHYSRQFRHWTSARAFAGSAVLPCQMEHPRRVGASLNREPHLFTVIVQPTQLRCSRLNEEVNRRA